MKVIVGKDIRIIDPSYPVYSYCDRELTMTNPDYLIAERLGRYVGKMDKELKLYVRNGNTLILPFGCLQDIFKLFHGQFEYETHFSEFKGNNLIGGVSLYDYQQKALEMLIKGKNGILQAPCGSGKTRIGIALIEKLKGKALWLTHTRKLLAQSKKVAKEHFSGDFGTITEGNVDIGMDITFATVQTMRNLDPSIYENEFDIVIIDECHHSVGTPTKVMQFYKVISNLNCRYKFGLTATPKRSDKLDKSMFALIGPKLYTITEQEVGNVIVRGEHRQIELDGNYNISDYCETDGMINYNKLITLLSEDKERTQKIIDKIIEFRADQRKQLVLCSRIEHIKYIHSELFKLGIDASMITSKVRDNVRNYEKDIIIATFALAKEGLDIPKLDLVHFVTPQKDKTIVLQSAGRVERNYVGKRKPLIIDYVDKNISYCVRAASKRKGILRGRK